jgi:hypothetical protein
MLAMVKEKVKKRCLQIEPISDHHFRRHGDNLLRPFGRAGGHRRLHFLFSSAPPHLKAKGNLELRAWPGHCGGSIGGDPLLWYVLFFSDILDSTANNWRCAHGHLRSAPETDASS